MFLNSVFRKAASWLTAPSGGYLRRQRSGESSRRRRQCGEAELAVRCGESELVWCGKNWRSGRAALLGRRSAQAHKVEEVQSPPDGYFFRRRAIEKKFGKKLAVSTATPLILQTLFSPPSVFRVLVGFEAMMGAFNSPPRAPQSS